MDGRSPPPVEFGCIGKAALRYARMYLAGKCFRRLSEVILSVAMGGQFPCGIQHGIGYRADVRVNSPEVAQNVKMKRGRFDSLRPPFTQPVQVSLGSGMLCVA